MTAARLTAESLESRHTPAPLAGGVWGTDYHTTYGFTGPLEDAWGNTRGVNWHAVAGLVGNGPRVVVEDLDRGGLVADFFAFEPEFRGGVVLESVNDSPSGADRLLIGAGPGGTPIVRQFDPLSGAECGPAVCFGDPATDRMGVASLTALVAGDAARAGFAGPRVYATLGPGAGPILAAADVASGEVVGRILIGPAGDRTGGYRVAPAGFAVRGPDWHNPALGVWVDGPAGPAAAAWYAL